jgi:hypothetical protein
MPFCGGERNRTPIAATFAEGSSIVLFIPADYPYEPFHYTV